MEKMAAPSVAELVRMAQALALLDTAAATPGLAVPEPV
jgi:hypothetical protein